MTHNACPFCNPTNDTVFYSNEHAYGIWDAFPSSPGHALIITRQHVDHWFAASRAEQSALLDGIAAARAAIEREHRPEGYNIGINIGAAAGQTVFHLHVHVIPRYIGDIKDPRGGVRYVLPRTANYLNSTNTLDQAGARRIITGGEHDPFAHHLLEKLDDAMSVSIATAFTHASGVELIEGRLREILERGGRLSFITGDYLGVTEPRALYKLLDLQGDVELRVFETQGTSFHPKAYILTDGHGQGTAFVGSSNLSVTALKRGVEWNYRIVTSEDEQGFLDVLQAFHDLWDNPKVKVMDAEWVQAYEKRRTPPIPSVAGVEPEPLAPPPRPHSIQIEALAALTRTRREGNTAGLVVLATGLGKTWLSAFDSIGPEYNKILFVAHREEILAQAMRTFRAIRPTAVFGAYNGMEQQPNADILFASIQTIGRSNHLHRFDPHQFDYIVVDEFHHAAAPSYSRLINYFEPKFLLGLTATPDRTDGGDLLSLCGNNLVYRCDVGEGISKALLCPFAYYGVPDEVDYTNIPWRSNRFDEEALTLALATTKRAENALEQLRLHGKQRTIAFCVSQRHADFMAKFFLDHGVRAVSVHSGPTSAPRAHSLELLELGDLDVVCAVDMFNEGVDLPNVDTILMLRPTESRILWLQQFGRGLRNQPGKTLQVIDYIGNHRVFLTKARALFDLGNSDREVAFALKQLDEGTIPLPPGCSITYDLEAKEILKALLRPATGTENLKAYYEEFRDANGVRPLALQVFQDNLNPRAARNDGEGSWFEFVRHMGDLSSQELNALQYIGPFLKELEVTRMTKSYKMVVLLGMIADDGFPGEINIERLVDRFADTIRRYAALRRDVGIDLDDSEAVRRLLRDNPINAWTGSGSDATPAFFTSSDDVFRTTFSVPEALRETAQDMARELTEWRLAEYMKREAQPRGIDRFVCKVSHSSGTPILFLPDRDKEQGIPEGWQEVVAGDQEYQAKFVKVAVNVMTQEGSDKNVLADLLREWFGPSAGQPGRTDAVAFERDRNRYLMRPLRSEVVEAGPKLWEKYSRPEFANAFGLILTGWDNQAGIIVKPGKLFFLVTLDKGGMASEFQYEDRFLSPTEFHWQSQNRNKQASEIGKMMSRQRELGTSIHLLVRPQAKQGSQTGKFYYCGMLNFERWEGEKPINVWWRLQNPVPERLWKELKVPAPDR